MSYSVIVEKPVKKFLARLAKPERNRILAAIRMLPFEGDIRPLQGGNNAGLFRLGWGITALFTTWIMAG